MAVIFPSAVVATLAALRAALSARGDSALVVAHVPDARPSRFVWVVSDGGPAGQVTSAQRIRVNCFDSRGSDHAESLALLVDALLRAAPDGAPIVAVRRVSGPFEVPDEQPRQYLLFDVTVRASDLT